MHYYRDEPFLANGPTDDNNSASFKFKIKTADRTEMKNTKRC